VPIGNELYETIDQKVTLEAENVLLQFDEVIRLIEESNGQLHLSAQLVKRLHEVAMRGIYRCAGKYRAWPVTIMRSSHKPPEHRFVADCVDHMCETANSALEWSPVQTGAYLLWRLSWIHPFGGGNGRTSRALSYLALSIRFGFRLPGKLTIPEQLISNRERYQRALEDADKAWEQSVLDFSSMATLLEECLERQLSSQEDHDMRP
jgi:Fic family protein